VPKRPKEIPDDDALISDISWRNPPGRPARYDWAAIAAKLQDNPMQWALVFTQDRASLVNALRQGGMRALHPDLGFESRTSNNVREPVRICDLYMRFNPAKVKPLRDSIRSTRKDRD
jgi:hypothetical protein